MVSFLMLRMLGLRFIRTADLNDCQVGDAGTSGEGSML